MSSPKSQAQGELLADEQSTRRIPGHCALCVSRCGPIAVVENEHFVAPELVPSHPTGKALCTKGRVAMDPKIELHSATAAERGIRPGDWVKIETPEGSVRGRARLNDSLKPEVVWGQHGWWQACLEIDAPGYDPFSVLYSNRELCDSLRAWLFIKRFIMVSH